MSSFDDATGSAWPPEEWPVSFVSSSKVVTGATSVTRQPVPVPGDGAGGSFNLKGRRWLYIVNNNGTEVTGTTIYIGGSDVTIATGYPLATVEMIVLPVTERIQVYVVRDTHEEEDPIGVRTLEIA